MSKLHKEQCGAQNTRTSHSSNKELSQNTLRALDELGDVLRKVNCRMIVEGYMIVDNQIQKM